LVVVWGLALEEVRVVVDLQATRSLPRPHLVLK
jgi:hypothetical protein